MFTKPCRRPSCTALVQKAMRSRLNATVYCSKPCGAQHRIEMGGHPFQQRTPESIHRNAVKAGKTRGERAKRRKLLDVAAKVRKHLPPDWELRYGATDLARIVALGVRTYLEGQEDGYQAGYTIQWRARQKGEAA